MPTKFNSRNGVPGEVTMLFIERCTEMLERFGTKLVRISVGTGHFNHHDGNSYEEYYVLNIIGDVPELFPVRKWVVYRDEEGSLKSIALLRAGFTIEDLEAA